MGWGLQYTLWKGWERARNLGPVWRARRVPPRCTGPGSGAPSVPFTVPRTAGLRVSGRGTRGRGRRGRSGRQRGAAGARARRGSLPRSGLRSLCKMGRTSVQRLTPELRTAAPLPPLLPARTPLVQLRAAAAATPASVIPVAYPHRSCGRGRRRDEPRQRRPAPECRPAPPRPDGAESAQGPAPRPGLRQGAGRAPEAPPSPAPSGSRSQ